MGFLKDLFGGGGDDEGPSMAEAWQLIGGRLGLRVAQEGEHCVAASGSVRGRDVQVSIEGRKVGSELLQSFATTNRKRVHQRWNTTLTVSCRNERGLAGTVEMYTDANHPSFDPRKFDPSQCRFVRSNPPGLDQLVFSESVRARLAPVLFDPRFEISPTSVRLVTDEKKVDRDGGYFVGSPIHVNYPNAPQPWPERAVAGPIWWIDLMCDIAEAVEG